MRGDLVGNPSEHLATLSNLKMRAESWLERDPARGKYRIDREAFTDPAIFELEMKYVFERNWIFLGHESQIANKHDFLTTYIGRFPVIISRDRSGELHGLINACAHRGARVCREKAGNRRTFSCPFHGWTYSNSGDLLDVTEESLGAYPPNFSRDAYGLPKIPRLESYRGFIFGSLSEDVQSLSDYLAGTKTFIDLMIDQSLGSELEVLPGSTRYTYKGNWKLQVENGLDGYHVGTTHANYVLTVNRRFAGESKNDTKTFDAQKWSALNGGFFSFHNGHAVLWNEYANPKDRPSYRIIDQLNEKYGETRAKWINRSTRNLLLFPNVFLMDQASTQIRIVRPIAVDETEVITYCIAPVGEDETARAARIRQYEDFFNASGMATPDDLTEFNNCQIGFGAGGGLWNDMSRGAGRWEDGAGKYGGDLGVDAIMSSSHVADEGLYLTIHEEWLDRMKSAIDAEIAETEVASRELA